MGETTIILENEAKKNEVQSPSENESSPLFSVDMLQVTQNAQNQNGFSNTNLQHNHSKRNKKRFSNHFKIIHILFNFQSC